MTSMWALQAQDADGAWGGHKGCEKDAWEDRQTATGVYGLHLQLQVLWSTNPASPSYSLSSQSHDATNQLSILGEITQLSRPVSPL